MGSRKRERERERASERARERARARARGRGRARVRGRGRGRVYTHKIRQVCRPFGGPWQAEKQDEKLPAKWGNLCCLPENYQMRLGRRSFWWKVSAGCCPQWGKALELTQIPGLVFGVQSFRGEASENFTICGLCQECTTKAGVMLKFQWQTPWDRLDPCSGDAEEVLFVPCLVVATAPASSGPGSQLLMQCRVMATGV